MPREKVIVTDCDVVTAYGWGIDPCWNGLQSGQTAIAALDRFETGSFQTPNAATLTELDPRRGDTLVLQMLKPLFERAAVSIPHDAALFLASTTGEIELLEREVLEGRGDSSASRLECLLAKIRELAGVAARGTIVSAACASSSAALAQAAAMVREGEADCALVVACDCVSEFVFAGFSSLMALDPDQARPFDRDRRGLSLGEAAGYALLMSESRAEREGRARLGEIAGWGLTNDANHMTGPSRDGAGLASAIRKTLDAAGVERDDVGCMSAHGTGTVYNDSMEIKAFGEVFGARTVPTYSVKGGTGHTMGAAGLVEFAIALRSLAERTAPPTVNLMEADPEAQGWVSREARAFDGEVTISSNSGFGGVNVALAVR